MSKESIKQTIEIDFNLYEQGAMSREIFLDRITEYIVAIAKNDEAIKQIREAAPCKFDNNGECIICDCWPSECAFERLVNQNYTYEDEEKLKSLFSADQIKLALSKRAKKQ